MFKMNQISRRDLRLETRVLDQLLKEHFSDIDIPVVDTENRNQVQFWNIQVIMYFLNDLLKLGELFFKSFQMRIK